MAPTLRQSISWTLAGRAVSAACQWSTLLVLARFGGPAAVGRFSLALAVTSPIVLFCNLSLRNVQATEADGSHLHADYVALRAYTTALALVVIAALVLAADYPPETAQTIALVGLAKAFEALSDVVQGLEHVHHRPDRAAGSAILRGLAGLAALALGYWLGGQLVAAVAAMTAASAAIYLVHDLAAARRLLARTGTRDPSAPRLRRRLRLLRLALPMGAVALLIALTGNVPRYFIEAALGEAALGTYAAMASFTVAGAFLINGLGQAALVELAAHHAAGRTAAFRRLLGRLVGVSLALGAVGVAVAAGCGRALLAGVFGEVFAREDRVFLWLTIAGAINYAATALFYGVTARRIFGGQAVVYAIVAAVHAAGCALLIAPYGLVGAVWAGIASLVVQILLSLRLMRRFA